VYAPVEDQDSIAQVGNGAVVFKLLKQEAEKWPQLQSDIIGKDVMIIILTFPCDGYLKVLHAQRIHIVFQRDL